MAVFSDSSELVAFRYRPTVGLQVCLEANDRATGWRRTDIDRDDDEIEAEYRRDRQEFELELERKGGNRFVLDIDFD